MNPAPLVAFRPLRLSVAVAFSMAAITLSSSNAFARGGYGAMRNYQRLAQQQMQFVQKQQAALEKQQKEAHDAFMKRFDTNKNGKIDGKEKGPAQRYLRELNLGKDPDKAIKSLGRSSSSSSGSFGSRSRKPASAKSK